jgi:hypothetical protein
MSSVSSRLVPAVLALVLLGASAKVGSAQEGLKPLAPDEKVAGLTLTDWATAWFQWDYSVKPRGR